MGCASPSPSNPAGLWGPRATLYVGKGRKAHGAALTSGRDDGSQGSGKGSQAPQDPHDASFLAGRACARRKPLLSVQVLLGAGTVCQAGRCRSSQSLGLSEVFPTCTSPSFHFHTRCPKLLISPPPRLTWLLHWKNTRASQEHLSVDSFYCTLPIPKKKTLYIVHQITEEAQVVNKYRSMDAS